MTTQAHITGRLNTTELGEAVAIELGTDAEGGTRAVHAVLNAITRAVVSGHTVAVTNFGTWAPIQRPARPGRNPKTGEAVTIPARQEMRFRVSNRLRALVAAQDPTAVSISKLPKGAL